MGGSIAITLAAARPDLVARLILAEANLDPGGEFVSKMIAEQTDDQFAAGGRRRLVERLTGLGFVTSAGSFQVCDSHALYRSAVGLVKGTKPTMRETVFALQIPRAYLCGEKSFPEPDTDELPQHCVAVPVISAAGHDMMFDNPKEVANAIKQALPQPALVA